MEWVRLEKQSMQSDEKRLEKQISWEKNITEMLSRKCQERQQGSSILRGYEVQLVLSIGYHEQVS